MVGISVFLSQFCDVREWQPAIGLAKLDDKLDRKLEDFLHLCTTLLATY
jgi:hypothetical protein